MKGRKEGRKERRKGGEGRGGEGEGREGKGREGKGREGKGREGKGREGKGREGREGKEGRKVLQEVARQSCADCSGQCHYLVTLTLDGAHAQFGVISWSGNPDRFLVADWWGGLRLQPGSTSGTQAQESCHRRKLRKFLELRSKLASFASALEEFTKSRPQDLRGQGPFFCASIPSLQCF